MTGALWVSLPRNRNSAPSPGAEECIFLASLRYKKLAWMVGVIKLASYFENCFVLKKNFACAAEKHLAGLVEKGGKVKRRYGRYEKS